MGWWFKSPLWARVLVGLVLGAIVGLAVTELRLAQGVDPGAVAERLDCTIPLPPDAPDGAEVQTLEPEACLERASPAQVTYAERAVAAAPLVVWADPVGRAFINLIRMLVMPLIFFTLVAGVVAMGDPKKLGTLGGRAIAMYMVTTIFAISLGLIAANVFQPGAGFSEAALEAQTIQSEKERLEEFSATEQPSLVDRLVGIIPQNPFAALAGGDVLAIIFFAIIFGAGILVSGEKGRPLANGMNSAADVMIRITEFIMQTAPIGVFALMVKVMGEQGLAILDNVLLLAAAHYAACLTHMGFTYGFIIITLMLRLPIIRFFRGMADAMAVAYSTSSSSATLPVTIANAVDNLGVKRPVASSVLPLGSTINMDGTALYQGVIAVFAAQIFNIPLEFTDYLLIVLTATLVSIGTAGIPSVSLFLAFITLGVIGIEGDKAVLLIAFIFPFDRLLDMMRTVTNITGDAAVATAVAKWEGELDEEVFRAPARI